MNVENTNENIDEMVNKLLCDIDKYKKEIKDLKDENEELEDDLGILKKKLTKNESENKELSDSLLNEQRYSKQLSQNFDKVKEELEEKTIDISLKTESLSFIQEILTAKQVTSSSIVDLHRKVDAVVDYIKGDLRDNIKATSKLNDDILFGDSLSRWSVNTKKTWINGKTTIAFIGEFSSGKTSIVNRILSHDDPNIPLLPVSTKATTAIPTYISGGDNTYYQFITPDNLQKFISEKTFKRVSKEVLEQVKGLSSLIQYFVMVYKNPNLENISILDTPGFSSNDKEDAMRTIEVINECDALFWVFDVNAGTVNRSSISTIKKNLKKPLYVVINKVDTKAKQEVDKVEKLINETFKKENVYVQKYIRFSAISPLEDIMKPIRSIKRDIEQDSYISNLRKKILDLVEYLNRRVQNLNKKYLELEKKGGQLDNKYHNAINHMEYICQELADIPEWKKYGIFKEDRYEIDSQQSHYYFKLLNELYQDIPDGLSELYKQQLETQRKAQKAYSDYLSEKARWQSLNNCKEQFLKLIKPLIGQ